MRRGLVTSLLFLVFATSVAEGKAFTFKEGGLAAYVRGGAGVSRLRQDAYANSSGSAVFADDNVKMNTFGEVGAQFVVGVFNMRLGIEALRPKEMVIQGKNAGGSELFELTSGVFAYSPSLTFEYVYSSMGFVRFYSFLTASYSFVTLDNKYEMTTAGNTAFSPATSYTEKAEGTAVGGVLGFGFETMFADNATFSLDFGYRHLVVNNFKHKAAGVVIGDTVAKGDPVLNSDGSKRQLDMGGLNVGVMFRFYIF